MAPARQSPQCAFDMSMESRENFAITISSRVSPRSSSTHEPSDPPSRVVSFWIGSQHGFNHSFGLGLTCVNDTRSDSLHQGRGLRLTEHDYNYSESPFKHARGPLFVWGAPGLGYRCLLWSLKCYCSVTVAQFWL